MIYIEVFVKQNSTLPDFGSGPGSGVAVDSIEILDAAVILYF